MVLYMPPKCSFIFVFGDVIYMCFCLLHSLFTCFVVVQVLFVKNLHPKVSEGDLFALFGNFPGKGEDPVKIQLMKGKMRGQAFVELKCKFAPYLQCLCTSCVDICI